ncbi:hypothetical protein B0I12_002889 [Microbacterium hydrothermale]|uniref:hypothetical protein n=1 Tax=Microbacterium hydrothermale TaxID=857427 RepID=UPI00222761DA|nr:hypothetical protein [Microbacterium hydrothermale]MCW2165724.1 hypothetical protein [Microbacterium hydrothermale]
MPRIDDDDELATLRRRAFAPGADISADPAAVQRLIELEQRARDALAGDESRPLRGGEPDSVAVDAPDDAEATEDDGEIARPRRRMPRVRRSTAVLLAGAALIVATLLTALVIVQRVQTDPLQVGATQVARLAPDPSFEIPSSLYRGITGNVKAYAAFEGFRPVTYPSFRAGEDAARCMTVYQPDLFDESEDGYGYEGQFLLPSCAAGLFPATFTILLTEDTPERAATTLPADTALQFVYDEDLDEIVVFRG